MITEQEIEQLREQIAEMVNVAGEALGTHPDKRNPACVSALAFYHEQKMTELNELRVRLRNAEDELSICLQMVSRMANEWGKVVGMENYQIIQHLDWIITEERKKVSALAAQAVPASGAEHAELGGEAKE